MFLCIFGGIVCRFAEEDPLRKWSRKVWGTPVLQNHEANKRHCQCSNTMILEQSQGSDKNATEMMFGQDPRPSPSATSSALWKPSWCHQRCRSVSGAVPSAFTPAALFSGPTKHSRASQPPPPNGLAFLASPFQRSKLEVRG